MTYHPDLTREALSRHSVDMRQFIDFRPSTLPNGVRLVEGYNASGFSFTILPDRGLDVWSAFYNGLPLTWISQGSPFAPDFGQKWLQQFNGGLLTTCGLTHVGPPETDPESGEFRDLHGQFSRLRAGDVAVRHVGWVGDEYRVELHGVVAEASLFGRQLRCERTYTLTLGRPGFQVADTITNLADQPAPLMLLYHVNLGYPLVAEGAEIVTPYEAVYPRDAPARAGMERWYQYDAAAPGYAEQVFFHHLKYGVEDNARTMAALVHEDFGLLLEWDSRQFPYLTQWKNTREGIYVCGVEPGNCIPEGQNGARRTGRLQILPPGQNQSFGCEISVLPDAESVQATRDCISELRLAGIAVEGCELEDYA